VISVSNRVLANRYGLIVIGPISRDDSNHGAGKVV
jgi:hypothetical protein